MLEEKIENWFCHLDFIMQKRMVKNRYAFLHDRKNLRFQNSFFLSNIDIRRYEVVIHAGRERLRIGFVQKRT